jgi:hypothetical protein
MALLLLLGSGCALAEPAEPGADSPQALLAAARQAGADRDAAAMVRLVAPSQLPLLALDTDLAAEMMSELAEEDDAASLATELARLRDEYGVRPSADGDAPELQVDSDTAQEQIDAHLASRAAALYEDVDLVGYVGAVSALLVSTPSMAGQPLFPPGEIGDVQVDGDRATVRVGEQEIDLVREEGRWYLAQPR